jgi:hypothetical protein
MVSVTPLGFRLLFVLAVDQRFPLVCFFALYFFLPHFSSPGRGESRFTWLETGSLE